MRSRGRAQTLLGRLFENVLLTGEAEVLISHGGPARLAIETGPKREGLVEPGLSPAQPPYSVEGSLSARSSTLLWDVPSRRRWSSSSI
jgi:hypothetical protein